RNQIRIRRPFHFSHASTPGMSPPAPDTPTALKSSAWKFIGRLPPFRVTVIAGLRAQSIAPITPSTASRSAVFTGIGVAEAVAAFAAAALVAAAVLVVTF